MKKSLAILTTLVLLLGLLAGCSSSGGADESAAPSESSAAPSEAAPAASEPASTEPAASAAPSQTPAQSAPASGEILTGQVAETPVTAEKTISYPVADGDVTFTVFASEPALGPLTGKVPIESNGEYETFKRSEEATGVNIDLMEASFQALTVQFNLMVASGEYTDIITGINANYAGGFSKAYKDDVIIDLKDIVADNCPDYWKYVAASESLARDTKDDSGAIFGIFSIYDKAVFIEGYVMREDWLKDVGMDAPTDFDQLHDVLTAFKTQYGLESPAFMNQTAVLMNTGYNIPSFDISTSVLPMYVEDGKAKCAFQSDSYRDWLETMNQWWTEGLIPQNFMEYSNDPFAGDTERLSLNNEIGLITLMSTSMPTYFENETSGFSLTPIMVNTDGTGMNHMTSDSLVFSSVSLSTACDDPELALQYINWWYTDEGQMCYNYGIEDTHYTLDENGEVQFTDMVINNEYGVSPTLYMRCFTIAGFGWGRTIQSRNWGFYKDYAINAVNFWTEHNDGAMAMPALSFTTEESETLAETATDLCTYVSERIPRFIMGELSLDTWDDFVAELEQFKMSDTVSIYQDAYDRYLAR